MANIDAAAPRAPGGAAILGLANNPWNDYWQTRQHILGGLAARGWPVGYSIGLLSRWDRGTSGWQEASWLGGVVRRDGVWVMDAGRLRLQLERWPGLDAWLLDRFVARFRRAVVGGTAAPPIVYAFHPRFLPYVAALPTSRLVYHADDNFAAMPGWDDRTAALQAAMVERADLIFCTTAGVARSLGPAAAGKRMLLPNGADAELFAAGDRAPCPADLAAIPRPRVSYVGTLNEKVDFALIAAIAAARPDWHWVLIGLMGPESRLGPQSAAARRRCLALANVHYLGVKPARSLPAYCAHVDANSLAYRTDGTGWWRDISPLKLHEYLAAGRPVVSADLASVRPFGEVVAICGDLAAWLAALEEARTGGRSDPATRRAVARANSWDRRVDVVEAALRGLVEAGVSSSPSRCSGDGRSR